ncbi:MAG: hypothetical protein VW778_09505, partial [Betaproteobacteria bacterium]
MSKSNIVFSKLGGLGLITSALLLTACSSQDDNGNTSSSAGSAVVPKITQEAVMTGLESPWDVDMLADGTMFYTEKC